MRKIRRDRGHLRTKIDRINRLLIKTLACKMDHISIEELHDYLRDIIDSLFPSNTEFYRREFFFSELLEFLPYHNPDEVTDYLIRMKILSLYRGNFLIINNVK